MDSKKTKIQILYKKDCGFCTACKNFSKKRNSKSNLDFIDIYSKDASAIFKENKVKKDYTTIWYFYNGEIYNNSKAIFKITQELNFFWRTLSYIYLLLPEKFWDKIYHFIVKKIDSNNTCSIE